MRWPSTAPAMALGRAIRTPWVTSTRMAPARAWRSARSGPAAGPVAGSSSRVTLGVGRPRLRRRRRRVPGDDVLEVEVARGLLLEPEPVVLGRLLEELGGLLQHVVAVGLLVGGDDVARIRALGLGVLERHRAGPAGRLRRWRVGLAGEVLVVDGLLLVGGLLDLVARARVVLVGVLAGRTLAGRLRGVAADGAQRLALLAGHVARVGAVPAPELEMVADRVVQQSHRAPTLAGGRGCLDRPATGGPGAGRWPPGRRAGARQVAGTGACQAASTVRFLPVRLAR